MTAGTATITPDPDVEACEKDGCEERNLLALIDPTGRREARALCPTHRVEYLREVANQ